MKEFYDRLYSAADLVGSGVFGSRADVPGRALLFCSLLSVDGSVVAFESTCKFQREIAMAEIALSKSTHGSWGG